jgi:hypothetical protein
MTPTEQMMAEINESLDWLIVEAQALVPIGKTPSGETIYVQRLGKQTDLAPWADK